MERLWLWSSRTTQQCTNAPVNSIWKIFHPHFPQVLLSQHLLLGSRKQAGQRSVQMHSPTLPLQCSANTLPQLPRHRNTRLPCCNFVSIARSIYLTPAYHMLSIVLGARITSVIKQRFLPQWNLLHEYTRKRRGVVHIHCQSKGNRAESGASVP